MEQGLDLKINRLPVRTWNWLKMNETTVKQVEVGHSPAVVTEGIGEVTVWNPEVSTVPTGMGEDMDLLRKQTPAEVIRILSDPAGKTECASLHFACEDGRKSFQPVELLVQEGEQLNVIMDFTSDQKAAGLSAVQTRFRLNKNARLKLVQIQLLGKGYTFLNDIGGICDDGASVEVVQLFLGGDKTCTGCLAQLDGRESTLSADIGYLGRGEQRFDMNYVADHRGAKTNSHIKAGGVLCDKAFKLFRGTIDFKYGAMGAEGDEKEDVLLLGENAVNQTIPLILCAEEDVQGNHGATIGRLDDELLFYLCSRGMSGEAAAKMITKARLEAVCQKIGNEAAEQLVQDYLKEVDINEQ